MPLDMELSVRQQLPCSQESLHSTHIPGETILIACMPQLHNLRDVHVAQAGSCQHPFTYCQLLDRRFGRCISARGAVCASFGAGRKFR